MNTKAIFKITMCLAYLLIYISASNRMQRGLRGVTFTDNVREVTTIDLEAYKDTQVSEYTLACNPCSNYGSNVDMNLGNFQMKSEGLISFDISSVPKHSNLLVARLLLPTPLYSPFATTPITVSIYKLIDNSWTESKVEWNSKPASKATSVGSVTVVYPDTPASVDVTDIVREEFNKVSVDQTIGFRLVVDSQFNVFFPTRESSLQSALLRVEFDNEYCGAGKCAKDDRCCATASGSICYNPATHLCIQNQLCGKSDSVCNGSCYNPSTHNCCSGSNGEYLCAK